MPDLTLFSSFAQKIILSSLCRVLLSWILHIFLALLIYAFPSSCSSYIPCHAFDWLVSHARDPGVETSREVVDLVTFFCFFFPTDEVWLHYLPIGVLSYFAMPISRLFLWNDWVKSRFWSFRGIGRSYCEPPFYCDYKIFLFSTHCLNINYNSLDPSKPWDESPHQQSSFSEQDFVLNLPYLDNGESLVESPLP